MGDEQETRQRILEKARELFFRYGYTRVSADRIAEELGMSKKTLYQHFPSKKEMLREAILMTMHELEVQFDIIARNESLTQIEKLRESFRLAALTVSRIQPDLIRDMVRTVPDIWRLVDGERQRIIFSHLRLLLSEGSESGIIREDINRELMLQFHFEMLRSFLTPERLAEMPWSMVEVLETALNIVYGGILTEKGRKELAKIDLKKDGGTA